jgi:AcrR family transcriptional regulator
VPRGALSRDRIVRAALEVIAADGADALSMRRVAAALGTRPMSLYHHVRDRDDLIDGILGELLEEVPFPPLGTAPWQTLLADGARAYRAALTRHRGVAALLLQRTGQPGAAWVRGLERGLAILRHAGFELRDALHALRALLALILGIVMTETMLADAPDGEMFPAIEATEDAPASLAEVAPLFETPDFDAAFEFALATLIAGLEHRLATA